MGRGAVTRRASTLAAAGRAWRTWGRRVPTRTPGPPPRRAHQPGHRLRPAARALSPDRRGDLRLAVSARSRRVHGWDRREPLWPRRGPHGIMTARGWGTRTRWAGRDRATGEVRDLVRARPGGPRGGNISYSGTLVKPRTSKSRASWTPPRRIRPGRPRHSGQPAPIGGPWCSRPPLGRGSPFSRGSYPTSFRRADGACGRRLQRSSKPGGGRISRG